MVSSPTITGGVWGIFKGGVERLPEGLQKGCHQRGKRLVSSFLLSPSRPATCASVGDLLSRASAEGTVRDGMGRTRHRSRVRARVFVGRYD